MRRFGLSLRQNWLPAAVLVGSTIIVPIAASCGQIYYRAYLTASLTVTGNGGMLSVSRAAGGSVQSPNGVTINSHGDIPYTLFIDQDSDAAQAPQNAGGSSASPGYELCRDPDCTTVWAPNGDPQTGILVTPGSASTALPLSVVRPANTAENGNVSDVVMLTMYF
jgi:hypothetical protein